MKPSQENQKDRKSINNLKQIRDFFRQEAEKAIKQIKEHEMLSLEEIRQGERLFDSIDDANDYLKSKNQQKKKIKKNKSIQKNQEPNSKKNQSLSRQQNNNKSEKKEKQKMLNKRTQNIIISNKQSNKNASQQIQFMDLHFDENRKWNENLLNPKIGKFQPQEKKILAQSLSQYLLKNNIQLHQFMDNFRRQHYDQLIPNDLKMWTAVCSVLPDRPLRSSYRFLMRMLNQKSHQSKWTESEEDQLISLHNKFGNKWRKISKHMDRTPQNIRDKFRTLQKKSQNSSKLWKIQQLILFLKYIQQHSKVQFIKQGIENLIDSADVHNSRQQQNSYNQKYNSKYVIAHNIIKILEYINADLFCKVDRKLIRWKQISEKIQTRNESDCKNKYLQLMEILNRDYQGKTYAKVIDFIEKQVQSKNRDDFREQDIQWKQWDEVQNQLPVEQAKFKWLMMKKKLRSKSDKSFQQILNEAKLLNDKKIYRLKIKQRKLEKEKLQAQKQNNKTGQQQKQVISQKQVQKKNQNKDLIKQKNKIIEVQDQMKQKEAQVIDIQDNQNNRVEHKNKQKILAIDLTVEKNTKVDKHSLTFQNKKQKQRRRQRSQSAEKTHRALKHKIQKKRNEKKKLNQKDKIKTSGLMFMNRK